MISLLSYSNYTKEFGWQNEFAIKFRVIFVLKYAKIPLIVRRLDNMKLLASNVVVIFWAIIFGEIIGYIASKLEVVPYNYMQIGGVAAVVALIAVNGIYLISKDSYAKQ